MKSIRLITILMISGWMATLPLTAQQGYFPKQEVLNLEFNFGILQPGTDAEVYDFLEEVLTFDADDLEDGTLDFKMHYQFSNYWSVGGSVSVFESEIDSEDRDFVDSDGFPILQTTRLTTAWFGANLIWTPFGAGEQFGSQGWAPKRFVPFLTGGAGFKSWELELIGDFVDVEDPAGPTIFPANFLAEGETFSWRFAAGFRFNVLKNLDLNFTYQRDYADDSLNGDFQDFGELDLDSTAVMLGVTTRF
jgi:opacity protein-like surface antigen